MPLKIARRNKTSYWYITGTLPGGKRIRESLRTSRKERAKELFAVRSAELHKEATSGASNTCTFAEAVVTYLQDGGESRFLKPILDEWHDRNVRLIRSGHARDLANEIYPRAKPATKNRQILVPITAVLNHAAERGFCAPFRPRRFKVLEVYKDAVDRSWIERFRQHASHDHLAALALFMFQTGARIGEAISLTPHAIDYENRVARIPKAKNGHPHAYHLSEQMAAELRSLPIKKGLVFGYRSRHSVYKAWRTSCARAGIAYVPPHQAGRHSFATEMIVRKGVDVATTAKLGGWRSAKVLLDAYTHPGDLQGVTDQVFSDQPVATTTGPTMSLYIMQTGDFYKIGVSKDPDARRSNIQISCPMPVRVVSERSYEANVAQLIETMVHKRLVRHCTQGEWFKCSLETISRAIRESELAVGQQSNVTPIKKRVKKRKLSQ